MLRPQPRSTLFPYTTLFRSTQAEMIEKIGQTLVCSAITNDKAWERQLLEAINIDRLNIGPIPTIKLDWLDRKSTRLNSSHSQISYAVFCLKKKKKKNQHSNS